MHPARKGDAEEQAIIRLSEVSALALRCIKEKQRRGRGQRRGTVLHWSLPWRFGMLSGEGQIQCGAFS